MIKYPQLQSQRSERHFRNCLENDALMAQTPNFKGRFTVLKEAAGRNFECLVRLSFDKCSTLVREQLNIGRHVNVNHYILERTFCEVPGSNS